MRECGVTPTAASFAGCHTGRCRSLASKIGLLNLGKEREMNAGRKILFLAGQLGLMVMVRFFFQWHKAKGTACFLGGICLVLYGWAMVGIIVEGWGFINLFGDFFPTALCAARASTPSLRLPARTRVRFEPPVGAVALPPRARCVGCLRGWWRRGAAAVW